MSEAEELREAIEGLRHQRLRRAILANEADVAADYLVVPGGSGQSEVVHLWDFLYAHFEDRRLHLHMADGTVVTGNTTFGPGDMLAALADHPQLYQVHERYLVNLAQLNAIGRAHSGEKGRVLYVGKARAHVPLEDQYAPGVQQWLRLTTLDHVVPWNDRYQVLLDENIREFEEPIRTFSVERLNHEFRYQTLPNVEVRQLIANMAWQYHSWLSLPASDPRKTRPIEGNIRTFWYYIKPVLSRLQLLDPDRQYDLMLDVFNRLVRKRLFRYREFGFVDEGANRRSIAPKERSPQVVLVSEKAGHLALLERFHEEFGITIIALRGAPSLLSAEYFIDEISDVIDLDVQPLRLISFVDYDPSGAIIIDAFRDHLTKYGVKGHTLSRVLGPECFSPEELPYVLFDVPMTNQAARNKAAKWIAAGGGVGGQPKGIECEALVFEPARLHDIVAKRVEEAQKPPTPGELFTAAQSPMAAWELPDHFSAELLEDDESDFWRRWAGRATTPATG